MFASVDIESGGLEPAGVAVFSVAVVAFDASGPFANAADVGFWRLDARWTPGRRDRDTYEWWQRQNQDTYAEAIGGVTLPWVFAEQFSTWCATWQVEEYWANPARFDFGHLRELYHQLGHAFPIHYKKERDLPTLKSLARDVAKTRGASAAERLEDVIKATYETNKTEHSALHDAIEQANMIVMLRSFLTDRMPL